MANVRTIRGTELPRARCAKIKGDFYEIGVDCHVRDGIYFRTDEAKRLAQQQ